MLTVKAKIRARSEDAHIVPIVIPDLDEVRVFAAKLHGEGKPWTGEAFG